MDTVLIRRGASDDQGTLGHLIAPGFSCYTNELPWRDNHPQRSCIPEGEYEAAWTLSPRLHLYTYEILSVPGRGGIRMHAGDLAGDVEKGWLTHSLGCPLLGNLLGRLGAQRAVLVSRPAVSAFERAMKRKPFVLMIERITYGASS